MATLPVTKVLVMEDRAQVERVGSLPVSGVTRIEISGVPLVAVDRSLQVEVSGATLIDAKLERRFKEQPVGGLSADASELRKRVHALDQQRAIDGDELARLSARVTAVEAARVDLLRSISQLTGHGLSDTRTWQQQLELLSQKRAQLDLDVQNAVLKCEETNRLYAEARQALSIGERGVQRWECSLVLTLEGTGTAVVRASYLVPCAVWRPAYRATLSSSSVQVDAEAVVWQRTGEDWPNVELSFSTARPTLGTTPPRLIEDQIHSRPKQTIEKRQVDVEFREEVIQSTGEGGDAPELPGLDDGGETRVLKATAPTTVHSDGHPHRVALFGFETKSTAELVCPAELSNLVFVQARFENTSGQVLLAGPVDLIRNSGLVGRAQLKFAAPGETVKLSFGNEDGLQIVRETGETTDEAMLTGRRTTVRTVQLHVSNMRTMPARVVIEERIPVSEVKQVEVQVLSKRSSPAPTSVSSDGVARIEVELAAQSTQTATFVWQLEAAAKVSGA